MNKRVPFAILCCFIIAFLVQGILKLCGVFIFEKVLDWEIFEIIDNNLWLNIIFNSIINIIAVYCLSFALTTRPYSNKWYHYIIIVVSSVAMMTLKLLVYIPIRFQFLIDVYLYIIVPIIINITINKQYKLFADKKISNFIFILTMQSLLYFCYLGLCYWSNILNSLLPIEQTYLNSMTMFLIYFEVYIGLIIMMLCCNIFLKAIIKGEISMNYPQNIASDKAKKEELARVKKEKENKKNAK